MDERTINFVKKYFSKFKQISKKRIDDFLLNNDVIESVLKNELFNHKIEVFQYIKMILNDIEFKYCKTCGNELSYDQILNRNEFCSVKCMRNSDEIKRKIIDTCIEKYGVDNAAKSESSKEKTKKTCIEKYGADHQIKNEEIKKKIFDTKSKLDVSLINERRRDTNLRKYGNEEFLSLDETRTKIRETNLKKYGSASPFGNDEIKLKCKNTLVERFGVDNSFKIDYIKELRRRSRFDIAYDTILSWNEYVIPLFSREEYHGYSHEYKWKCAKCGREFSQRIYGTFINDISERLPRCLKCYPYSNGFSNKEIELLDFCKEHFNIIKYRDKELIHPYELDIVIPEMNLAIEFNGCYWHSENAFLTLRKGDEIDECLNYHLNKTRLSNEKGYRLIHVWEDEWDSDKEGIKRKLIEIFEGNENLNFMETEIKLDRSWYNNVEIPGYTLKEEIKPEKVKRSMFDVWNCGYLVYERNKYN